MVVAVEHAVMQKIATAKRENLPGLTLVGAVVAGTVWLVHYHLGIEGSGLKVVVGGLIALLIALFYSDQVASNLDELLYAPNYHPKVLTAERQGTEKRWRYLFLPNWRRMHAKRTEFGAGLPCPIPEDGKGFFETARDMLLPEDRKAVEKWLGYSKALRSIVPFLVLAAAIEIIIALAWQPPQQRYVDLVIAAGELVLALAATRAYLAWRVRYLEELYERANRTARSNRH
jgi:hypothetical protein